LGFGFRRGAAVHEKPLSFPVQRIATGGTRQVLMLRQSAKPTAAPKRRGLPCAGFAVTDVAHAPSGR
jgi:hypothetical protein